MKKRVPVSKFTSSGYVISGVHIICLDQHNFLVCWNWPNDWKILSEKHVLILISDTVNHYPKSWGASEQRKWEKVLSTIDFGSDWKVWGRWGAEVEYILQPEVDAELKWKLRLDEVLTEQLALLRSSFFRCWLCKLASFSSPFLIHFLSLNTASVASASFSCISCI